MRDERRAILALMAAGRISALEAERLLRAWNERWEGWWIVVLCGMVCLMQAHGIQVLLDFSGAGMAEWLHRVVNAAGSLLTKGAGTV